MYNPFKPNSFIICTVPFSFTNAAAAACMSESECINEASITRITDSQLDELFSLNLQPDFDDFRWVGDHHLCGSRTKTRQQFKRKTGEIAKLMLANGVSKLL